VPIAIPVKRMPGIAIEGGKIPTPHTRTRVGSWTGAGLNESNRLGYVNNPVTRTACLATGDTLLP